MPEHHAAGLLIADGSIPTGAAVIVILYSSVTAMDVLHITSALL